MTDLPAVRKADPLRIPPHSIDAEQAVLGGLMLSPDALNEIADWFDEGDFYRRDHQLIYRAIVELRQDNKPADAVTMGEWFADMGIAELVGGQRYILDLANTTPSASNIVAYAEVVKEKSNARKLIDIGTELAGDAFVAKGASSRDIASTAAAKIMELAGAQRIRGARNFRDIGRSWFKMLMDRMESRAMPGLPTKWAKFNKKTGGLQRQHLYIVASRPSIGKTVVLIDTATPIALAGHRVMVFSMEQSAEQLYTRAACALVEVNSNYVREPDPDDDEAISRLSGAVMQLQDAPLIIDDSPGLTWQQVVIRAKREHMRSPLSAVFVDHLHIMTIPGKFKEATEYSEITRQFKALAKVLDIPVILLAQLNRNVESRTNKRPMLADLREAPGLEQDGDVIVFLYRDDYYAEQEGRQSEYPGTIEMNIAKWRDGETGVVWGQFHGAYSRIDHMEHAPQRIAPTDDDRPRKRAKRTYGAAD